MREAYIKRETKETKIELTLNVDGEGKIRSRQEWDFSTTCSPPLPCTADLILC